MTDSEKLLALADWFDQHDLKNGRTGTDVQDDLRRIAKRIEGMKNDLQKRSNNMSTDIDKTMLAKARGELTKAKQAIENIEIILDTLYASHAASDGVLDDEEKREMTDD